MLKQIEKRLTEANIGFEEIAATPQIPFEQLAIALPNDQAGRERRLWMTPLPGLEDELGEGVSLWQFWVELPFKSVAAHQADLNRLILTLNNLIHLGAFGVLEPDRAILFRYVWMLGPDQNKNSQGVVDVVLLTSYYLDQFGSLLEPVANGQKTVDQTLLEIQPRQ